MLPTKQEIENSQAAFAAYDNVRFIRIMNAVANREECGYDEASLTRQALKGYPKRNSELIEALERIEQLEKQLGVLSNMTDEDGNGDNGNFTVVGLDTDGGVLCRKDDGEIYNCGETLEEFGIDNLHDEERVAVGLTPKDTLQGLHDTGPEVEEFYDDTKRGGSESGT